MKKPKVYFCRHKPSAGQELCVQRCRVFKENCPMWVQAHNGPAPICLNKARTAAGEGERAGGLHRAELLHYIGSREASLCLRAAGTSSSILYSLQLVYLIFCTVDT